MEVNVYAYIEDGLGADYCFKCAVRAIIHGGTTEPFNLVLEQGSTDTGQDMRSAPKCCICGNRIQEHCIA